ncbi:hypothetical protein [Spirosoma flavum]|uniref:SGNH/GDSL hydrolase family protein n=1 Tax=Spirosoma flavum TaxID=2048557 RepID=A0ABW6API0_9BACT
MLYSKVWIKGSIVSLLSFIFSWLVLEGVCSLLLHWKERAAYEATNSTVPESKSNSAQNKLTLIKYDSLGILRPAPGPYTVTYPIRQDKGDQGKRPFLGKTASVTYTIDSLSRRFTPFDNRQAAGKYALFLGCSFTYGESVSDTSTMPYFFGKQTGYRPYNYGVSGYSPAHMLALQQAVDIRKEVVEKKGIAFYTYIEDHLARVAPSTKWIYNSNGYWPYVNPNTLAVEGAYAQKHPVYLELIRGMYKSNIVKFFNINLPRRYNTEQYEQFVRIVKKSEELYQKQFGNDDFYVIVFPAYPMAPELRQLFKQAHLKVMDYSALLSWKTAYDNMHPDDEAYRQVAQTLATDLGLESDRNAADQ